MNHKSYTVDARGLACPKPIIMTKQMLDAIREGIVVTIANDAVAVENLKFFAENEGHAVHVHVSGEDTYVTITKTAANLPQTDGRLATVVVISSDCFGTGADELSRMLMKNFLHTLGESRVLPESVIFLNSGVFLAVDGSDALEPLERLTSIGVEILCCGACLNYYALTEKFTIGKVTNMYTVIEKMLNAGSVIHL